SVVIIISRSPNFALLPYSTLFRSHPAARRDTAEVHARLARSHPVAFGPRVVREGGCHHHTHTACCRLLRARHRPHGRARDLLRRSEEHTSALQSRENLVCRLLIER